MSWKKWEKLPEFMQTEAVRPYYESLKKKRFSLFWKRVFDIIVSLLMLILLSPLFLILAIAIKIDSKGPVFFRQERITQYGKTFRIFKFRTMVNNADKQGSAVTVKGDARVTKVGAFLRKVRLDEISQLIDVFRGTMSFVGTRPEVKKYVDRYTDEMMATLLLPAGVTSEASICFKDEAKLLQADGNPDDIYVNDILPKKMEYNLISLKKFGFWRDIGTMFRTVFTVLKKDRSEDSSPSDSASEEKSEPVCLQQAAPSPVVPSAQAQSCEELFGASEKNSLPDLVKDNETAPEKGENKDDSSL